MQGLAGGDGALQSAAAEAYPRVVPPRQSVLISGDSTEICIVLPPGFEALRVKLEYDEKSLSITGPGRLPDKATFELVPNEDPDSRIFRFQVTVRQVAIEVREPVVLLFSTPSGQYIGAETLFLKLGPQYEFPNVLYVPQGYRWVAQQMKRLRGRPLRHMVISPLVLWGLLAIGTLAIQYYKLSEADRQNLLINLRLWDQPFLDADGFRENFQLAPDGTLANPTAWSVPAGWTIIRGIGISSEDGALSMLSPGYLFLRKEALAGRSAYDFTLETKLVTRGEIQRLGLILRGDERSGNFYLLELETVNGMLRLKPQVVRGWKPVRRMGRRQYISFSDFPCCGGERDLKFTVTGVRYGFSVSVTLEGARPLSDEDKELLNHPNPLDGMIYDYDENFRFGQVGWARLADGPRMDVDWLELRQPTENKK